MFNPVAFHLFGWPVRWYGITMALSLLIATYLGQRLLESRGRKGEYMWDGVLWAAVFGIVGARAVYVLTNLGDYAGHWLDAFKIYEGGLSMHGALACGLLGCWLYYRRTPLKLLEVMDAAAPGIAIGIMLVRFVGNLANGDILGYKVSRDVVPWAMNFPRDEYHALDNATEVITRHPTEIYGGLVGAILLILTLVIWHRRYAPGTNMFAFIAGYSLVRSVIEEPFRHVPHYGVHFYNQAYGFGGVTLTQWVSLVFITIGIWGIIVVNRRSGAEAWAPPPEPEAATETRPPKAARKLPEAPSAAKKKQKPFAG